MAHKHQCELYLVRWMPNVVKGHFANVGIVLVDQASGVVEVRFTRDYRLLKSLDPNVDLDVFKSLEEEIRGKIAFDRAKFFEKVPDWTSNALQLSLASGVETNDFYAELALLTESYLAPARLANAREVPHDDVLGEAIAAPSGRLRSAKQRLHAAFAADDLRRFFKWNIEVSRYVPGDPLIIDCGYEANGAFKMFHAISLRRSTNEAKALAFSYAWFSDAFQSRENLTPHLAAVIDGENAPSEHVDFAARAFSGTKIQPVMISELPRLVELARQDLRI